MKSHYAQKRDANEAAIVDALIENGFEVLRCNGLPFDLIVGRNAWIVIEVKGPVGRLTESQALFFEDASGVREFVRAPRFVVRTVEEALELAGRYC